MTNIVPTPTTRRLAQTLVDASAADDDQSPSDVTLSWIEEIYDLPLDQLGPFVAVLLGYEMAKPTEQIKREEFTEEQLREGARIYKRWDKTTREKVLAQYPHNPDTRWIVDARRQYDLWCRREKKRRDEELAAQKKPRLKRAS